jgi:hypothetical protein
MNLFDHLTGAGEQCWRHRDAERFGGLEIGLPAQTCLIAGSAYHRVYRLFLRRILASLTGRPKA